MGHCVCCARSSENVAKPRPASHTHTKAYEQPPATGLPVSCMPTSVQNCGDGQTSTTGCSNVFTRPMHRRVPARCDRVLPISPVRQSPPILAIYGNFATKAPVVASSSFLLTLVSQTRAIVGTHHRPPCSEGCNQRRTIISFFLSRVVNIHLYHCTQQRVNY